MKSQFKRYIKYHNENSKVDLKVKSKVKIERQFKS